MVLTISLLAEVGCMVLVQAILLRMQLFHQRNPHLAPLSSFEKLLIATGFWASIKLFGRIFGFGIHVLDSVASSVTSQQIENHVTEPPKYTGHVGFGSLLYKIMASCLIHQAANFCLEIVVPFWEEFNRDGESAQRKVEARIAQSFGGFRELNRRLKNGVGYDEVLGRKKNSAIFSAGQLISLERHKVEDKKERTLDWDIVVGKGAMDEMKETLGPPGGFGELGFVVEQDGVSFQAMGVGTKFNLRFSVGEKPDVQLSKE